MSDHRAEIKIEFHYHGKCYKKHWNWINWSEPSGVDSRVTDWLRECAEDGYARYEAKQTEVTGDKK